MDHSTEISELKERAATIQAKIDRIDGKSQDSHLNGVAQHFHLGMVGGSGRNTHRLNQRRERSLDKTIENAKTVTALYRELSEIEAKIKDLENNGPEKRATKEQERDQFRAQYWNNLKAGDTIDHGNGPVTIVKKYKKSLTTATCSWKAEEIIGKKAAALI